MMDGSVSRCWSVEGGAVCSVRFAEGLKNGCGSDYERAALKGRGS
jgi:hypothetical protein